MSCQATTNKFFENPRFKGFEYKILWTLTHKISEAVHCNHEKNSTQLPNPCLCSVLLPAPLHQSLIPTKSIHPLNNGRFIVIPISDMYTRTRGTPQNTHIHPTLRRGLTLQDISIYLSIYIYICWSVTPLSTFYTKTEFPHYPPYTPTLSNKNIKNSPERGGKCFLKFMVNN